MTARTATLSRKTGETQIELSLDLDPVQLTGDGTGAGETPIDTGIGFLDHMLTAFARHGRFGLRIAAHGDLHVDLHHTTEDVGIVLGQAFEIALGDKRGITRYGHAVVPMDEARVEAAIDISGRPFLVWDVTFRHDKIGEMDTELFEEFFRALSTNARIALHITQGAGRNDHHVAEASFKAVARAFSQAVSIDPRQGGVVPSTKGSL